MSAKFLLTLTAAFCMSGCATVDLAEVAASNSSFSRPSIEKTVVERAAGKLYAVFTTKGWSVRNSRNKVKLTANVLLNGLEQQNLTTPLADNIYVKSVSTVKQVRGDIAMATAQVEQTTKAAEVYLAVAPVESTFKLELKNLERALIASRDAEVVFTSAFTKLGETEGQADITAFESSVDTLSRVTDIFGERVRNIAPATNAALSAS